MYPFEHIFVSKNEIGTNIYFTLNLLGHHFDYDHHFIMAFILQPFFHKLGSQEDLQRIRFMLPKSENQFPFFRNRLRCLFLVLELDYDIF